MATLDSLILPEDLIWIDEFNWTPVQQSEEFTVTGALIIDSGIKQAGRKMTMQGGVDYAWIDRGNLKILYDLLPANAEMTLTLNDARVFTVIFDHQAQPIESSPIIDYSTPIDADKNALTVRLILV